jgi:hypothetical protein
MIHSICIRTHVYIHQVRWRDAPPLTLHLWCVSGNIAHGAKVGANHTGRLPDQEAAIGEGVFFGTGGHLVKGHGVKGHASILRPWLATAC